MVLYGTGMNRAEIARLKIADIVRAKGRQFLGRFKAILSYLVLKAFRAVSRCRTAALGGHKDKCVNCQFEAPISYNSAAHGAVTSARRGPAGDGSKPSNATCATPTTFTLSSPCSTS
jgi:hypothetical protein